MLSARGLQERLGAGRAPADAVVTSRVSGASTGSVSSGAHGRKPSRPAGLGPEYFRSTIGLRSSRFALGVLDLAPTKTKSVCGARVRIDVLAREAGQLHLQRRPSSGIWKAVSITKDDAAHYHAIDRPCRSMSYRLHSPAANTRPSRSGRAEDRLQRDAARQRRTARIGAPHLAGRSDRARRPQLRNGKWAKNVGTAAVQSDGTWHAHFKAVAGTYRARLAPPASSGLVPGVSPVLNFN